jgi:hypothetical protein
MRRISARSSALVSRSPAARHCCTAASQPARLKMKLIAGSRSARSSRSITSARGGGCQRRLRPPLPFQPGPVLRSVISSRRSISRV